MPFKVSNPAHFLLRLGLSYVFLFVAISTLLNPNSFAHYVPQFVGQLIPANLFLIVYGVFEVFLALWLLSGLKTLYAALIAAAILFVLTALNFNDFGILFRNVAIFYAALALAVLSAK